MLPADGRRSPHSAMTVPIIPGGLNKADVARAALRSLTRDNSDESTLPHLDHVPSHFGGFGYESGTPHQSPHHAGPFSSSSAPYFFAPSAVRSPSGRSEASPTQSTSSFSSSSSPRATSHQHYRFSSPGLASSLSSTTLDDYAANTTGDMRDSMIHRVANDLGVHSDDVRSVLAEARTGRRSDPPHGLDHHTSQVILDALQGEEQRFFRRSPAREAALHPYHGRSSRSSSNASWSGIPASSPPLPVFSSSMRPASHHRPTSRDSPYRRSMPGDSQFFKKSPQSHQQSALSDPHSPNLQQYIADRHQFYVDDSRHVADASMVPRFQEGRPRSKTHDMTSVGYSRLLPPLTGTDDWPPSRSVASLPSRLAPSRVESPRHQSAAFDSIIITQSPMSETPSPRTSAGTSGALGLDVDTPMAPPHQSSSSPSEMRRWNTEDVGTSSGAPSPRLLRKSSQTGISRPMAEVAEPMQLSREEIMQRLQQKVRARMAAASAESRSRGSRRASPSHSPRQSGSSPARSGTKTPEARDSASSSSSPPQTPSVAAATGSPTGSGIGALLAAASLEK